MLISSRSKKELVKQRNRNRNAAIHYVLLEPKIGRNAKCPCGSGKKFKSCCIDGKQGLDKVEE